MHLIFFISCVLIHFWARYGYAYPTGSVNTSKDKENSNVTSNKNATDESEDCERWIYELGEYKIFPNGTASTKGALYEPGTYELDGDDLITCIPTIQTVNKNDTSRVAKAKNDVLIYIGKIGSGISIFALLFHLLTFYFVPSLRNLPGWNLASLIVAFLFAYSFVLIGQIPEVLGLSCVISGILQQNFFLAAFFCMNVLAFDVWRTLRLATQKLIVGSQNVRRRQFVWYSLYAWGSPLIITSTSALLDNIDGVPEEIKPKFGEEDTCWMNNGLAIAIFFAIPSFTLFFINAIFFILSFSMIRNNTMKSTHEQQKQTVKLNYILYVRLGLMMGVTWLIGIIAAISKCHVIWVIHDLLNSLQGLFLFLLFTCSRKVMKHLRERTSSRIKSSEKQSTCTTNTHSSRSSHIQT